MSREEHTDRPLTPNAMLKRAFHLPITQMAWREVRKGSPSECLEQLKVPVMHDLAPGELLVKVEAAALNPVGYKLMQMLPNAIAKRPHTAESDFTGIVVSSQGVTEFQYGDAVCGWIPQPMSQITSQGALCEFVRVRSDHVIHRPSNITPTQGAGVCLAGLSAWKLLFEDAKVQPGHRILIYNGSGGVGMLAIQIAKAHGCHVTATASPRNFDLMKKLGADNVLDHHAEPIAEALVSNPPNPPFDAIVDCYGLYPDLYANCEKYLKPEGIFASVTPAAGSISDTVKAGASILGRAWRPSWLGGNPRKLSILNLENSKEELRKLETLLAAGKVIPVVDSVYKFDDALLAYERLMSRQARGKVVIAIEPELYLQSRKERAM